MKNLTLLAAMLAILTGSVVAQGDHDHEEQEHDHGSLWVTDYDEAMTKAKEEKKDLLVDFTGSDWCGWCIRLDKEVFDHHEFLDPIQKNYVLVKLDFPRGEEAKAKVKNPQRNEELSRQFGIRGFPSILLVSRDGDVYGRTGYQEGGPEKYLAHINELAATGKKNLAEVTALKEEYAKAEGEAKTAVVGKAIAFLEKADENTVGASSMAKIARDAFTLDPKNEKGMKLRAVKALLAANEADDAVMAMAKELDPKNENGLLERMVFAQMGKVDSEEAVKSCLKAVDDLVAHGAIKDKEVAQMLYANAAFWSMRVTQDMEKAKAYAEKLKAMEDLPAHFQPLIKQILGE